MSTERAFQLECNISIETNHLLSGLQAVSRPYSGSHYPIPRTFRNKLRRGVQCWIASSNTSSELAYRADLLTSRKTRLSRIPAYLAVHMVILSTQGVSAVDIDRSASTGDEISGKRTLRGSTAYPARKKAKIMRKVSFPARLDVMDMVGQESVGMT